MKQFHKYPLPVKFINYYKERKSIELIIKFLQENKNTNLALSFGKDSMVILHMLYKYDLLDKLKLIMWNRSGFDAKETLELRNYVKTKYYIQNYDETFVKDYISYLDIENINISKKRCSFPDFVYNVLEMPRWKKMDEYDIDSTIIGLRIEESKGRKINFKLRGYSYYNKREKANILQPIIFWTTEDIFRYSFSENIPIHPVYYRSKEKGFDFMKERVNMLIDNDCAYLCDRIMKVKILYPNDYKDIISKIPQLRR